jgi:Family of unknown function (DUF6069)
MPLLRTSLFMLLACSFAFAIDFTIARAGLRFAHVPGDFPPFTMLPILSGCAGGALMASFVYAVLKAVSSVPERAFLFVAVTALALSFALPLRLSFTKSARFAGVTPAAQMILVLMHTVVATVTVVALLADPK